jgi:hypothetical protein
MEKTKPASSDRTAVTPELGVVQLMEVMYHALQQRDDVIVPIRNNRMSRRIFWDAVVCPEFWNCCRDITG